MLKNVLVELRPAAELTALLVGAMVFYEARAHSWVAATLRVLGRLERHVMHARTVTRWRDVDTGAESSRAVVAAALVVSSPPPRPPGTIVVTPDGSRVEILEEYRDNMPLPFYVLGTLAVLGVLTVGGHSVGYWLVWPFALWLNAIAAWGELSLSWSVVLVPLTSGAWLVAGLIALLAVYTLGVGIPLKSSLLAAGKLSTALTPSIFKFILFALFVVSGSVVLATS